MKFLCVRCDEPMKLEEARPPDAAGSIAAVYGCPTCDTRIAMLTNAHETQLVQSLGVRIGPATAATADGVAAKPASGCPFSGMVATPPAEEGLAWTAEALERLERIPEFVRPMARQGVESFARGHGRSLVDGALMDEARGRMGI